MSRLNFLYCSDLPHRAVSVYVYLDDRANKDGECWPSIKTIAKELKLSQSTVRRALCDLRKANLVETVQRYRKKGGKSSLLYKLKRCKKKRVADEVTRFTYSKNYYSLRQEKTALFLWKVPPVITEGEGEVPNLKVITAEERQIASL